MEKRFKQIALDGVVEKDYRPSLPPSKVRQRLTEREKNFALYWLETHKIGESARRANYSEKHANAIGSRLLKKSQVAEFIKEQEEETIRAAGINRKDVLLRLAKMVYWDPRSLYREDGSTKGPSEWDDATCAVIAGIEVMEVWERDGKKKISIGQTKKIKVVDPLRALEVLMKHLGLLKESIVYPDKNGNPMAPVAPIQTKIQVVFVPAPGEKNPNDPVMTIEGNEL